MFVPNEHDNPYKSQLSLNLSGSPSEDPPSKEFLEERRYSARSAVKLALVVLAPILMLLVFLNLRLSQQMAALSQSGQRVSALLLSSPRRVKPRMMPYAWEFDYSFVVRERTYRGHALMFRVPRPLTVVYDPLDPRTHRLVGALDRNRGFGLVTVFLGVIVVSLLAFLWISRRSLNP